MLGASGSKKSSPPSTNQPVATLFCLGGSEKQELMADPQVQKILLDRYHLRVQYQPEGSYQQVQQSTSALKALWISLTLSGGTWYTSIRIQSL